MPRCSFFQVFANGQPVDVLSVGIASIARIEMDGPVKIEVRGKGLIARGEIRPRRLGIPDHRRWGSRDIYIGTTCERVD